MANRLQADKENIMKSTNLITNSFRVKKCLFNSPKNEAESCDFKSPVASKYSPGVEPMEDSPFAMYQVNKRRSVGSSLSVLEMNDTPLKKSVFSVSTRKDLESVVMDSPTDSPRKKAVQKSMAECDLTGDFTKTLRFPTIKGVHPDLKVISPQTVADLLKGSECRCGYEIIDCRYPYEYHGGHISNAINIYDQNEVESRYFSSEISVEEYACKILIMYCEFSSQRAPSMIRHFRNLDREKNKDRYPHLFYPEIYLIQGGYKAFYSVYQELCHPHQYITMLDEKFSEKLAFYRSKSKPRNKAKGCKRARTHLVFGSPLQQLSNQK